MLRNIYRWYVDQSRVHYLINRHVLTHYHTNWNLVSSASLSNCTFVSYTLNHLMWMKWCVELKWYGSILKHHALYLKGPRSNCILTPIKGMCCAFGMNNERVLKWLSFLFVPWILGITYHKFLSCTLESLNKTLIYDTNVSLLITSDWNKMIFFFVEWKMCKRLVCGHFIFIIEATFIKFGELKMIKTTEFEKWCKLIKNMRYEV